MAKLEIVPEDWERALAVVAHPDDLEYGAAAAVARWTDQGKAVSYLLVTSGEAGIDTMAPDECARVRQDEERRSAALVGVDTVEFLAHPDGLVEASIALRRDLATAIRRHRPEVVLSINFRDSWGGPSFNHADHRATGVALLDAVRDAGNRWVFPGAGGEPWSGVRFALFSGAPDATHGADVTATVDRGIASLREHRTYLEALDPGSTDDPTAFLRANAEAAGPRLGVAAAATFELIAL
ncbi:PIG-L deacetylase family protein [Aquihabitans sp. G128]|uniref:PIG-L deacetylase family protein n=1 Tax=Aquihabitans sp. G128 TaxID=2849779 RepID=UPI0020B1A7CC|nr:PIG-L deacetylase family protein [Aquihabitans sp. G128]